MQRLVSCGVITVNHMRWNIHTKTRLNWSIVSIERGKRLQQYFGGEVATAVERQGCSENRARAPRLQRLGSHANGDESARNRWLWTGEVESLYLVVVLGGGGDVSGEIMTTNRSEIKVEQEIFGALGDEFGTISIAIYREKIILSSKELESRFFFW